MTPEEPDSPSRPEGGQPEAPSSGIAADERPSEEPEATGEGGASPRPGGKPRGQGRPRWLPLAAAIAVGGVILFGLSYFVATRLFARSDPSAGKRPGASGSPGPGSTDAIPANWVTFKDDQAGVSISYPKSWTKFSTPGDEYARLAAGARDSGDLLRLRVIPVPTTIDPATVFQLKESFDKYVNTERVNVIKQQQITLNGLVGWHYLYTFADPDGGSGIQSRYLLANGAKIDDLVFQALPKEDFKDLAKLFDKIAGTFRSTPRAQPSPAPSPGT